jgi:phospholipase C
MRNSQSRRALLSCASAIALLAAGGMAAAAPPLGLNDNKTSTPIKHVIIIVGENRSLDHVFGTYVSPSGDAVSNILAKGIVNADGTPGPKFGHALQRAASVTTTFSISPTITGQYRQLPPPNLNFTPNAQSYTQPPFISTQVAAQYDYGLLAPDLKVLTTGASGLPFQSIDTRIADVMHLPNGPFQLSPGVGTDDYANSPVHRFYQMFQQLDCSVNYVSKANASGCRADLFPWVEVTVGAGTNGNPQPPDFNHESTHEGATAMGFYNVQQGDAPYLKKLADEYTLLDNYHQPAKGGTGLDSLYLGFADALWYSDGKGNPAKPPKNQIENVEPQPGTNNWYTQDGYSGGSYSDCSDTSQSGVGPINSYLQGMNVSLNCTPGHYYLLNNYAPGYFGDGSVAPNPTNGGGKDAFTIPPSPVRSIGDSLIDNQISWRYYSENWNQYVADLADYYVTANNEHCDICNPFQYQTSIMTGADANGVPYRLTYLKDTTDLYSDLQSGIFPAVAYVKPSGLNDGHPESSKLSIFEAFTKKILTLLASNQKLAESTAVIITVDEGGGYWDSGYVAPLDFFGDGTRIPTIIVSPFTKGGHVSHVYSDHASVVKFIEANWGLGPLTGRSRDNLPNPITTADDPYVPTNGPALSDLVGAFRF